MSFPMQPVIISQPVVMEVPECVEMPPTINYTVLPQQVQVQGPMLNNGFAPQYQQPIQHGWINALAEMPDCPVGLEYLTQIDQLLVKQNIELFEIITGYETNNSYMIKNTFGQNIYVAAEHTDCCTRQCCGSSRPFDIGVVDACQREVLHFSRPLACSSCCFPCCLQSLEVTASGELIGSVEQEWSFCYPNFSIKNHAGETVLRIKGPFCTSSCCGDDVEFSIVTLDGSEVGKISKQWSGWGREAFTDADNFGIKFPMDLDVRMKAVALGACLLIDFMFFEDTQQQ